MHSICNRWIAAHHHGQLPQLFEYVVVLGSGSGAYRPGINDALLNMRLACSLLVPYEQSCGPLGRDSHKPQKVTPSENTSVPLKMHGQKCSVRLLLQMNTSSKTKFLMAMSTALCHLLGELVLL